MTVRVGVIILAAGCGSRFDAGGRSVKVLAPLHGVPLVRIVAETALGSRAVAVAVVTGPSHAEVAEALRGVRVTLIHNANSATGLASSLQTGLQQVSADIDGILVMLADMPLIKSSTLDLLVSRFEQARDTIEAVIPVYRGRRGNPALIGRRLFARIETLSGDEGARQLLATPAPWIEYCQVDDPGVTIDVDTSIELAALQ